MGGKRGSDDCSVVFHVEIFSKKKFSYLPTIFFSKPLSEPPTNANHVSTISLFLALLNCLKGIY